ncbi:transient receptor potential cation channel subfamily M member 3-like isoform X4 [Pomacea canaliculata]|uniref:transient receptor potential cation channel subfamily M member 3-like isoform X4 n=1 Tax=Pomacea canaliculata TaxID=400727 RepID=UPI000D72ADD1|nr:transient receptor potential cation channel subfamily M member 3-like isoform X4 [Pomacea canaliculata]
MFPDSRVHDSFQFLSCHLLLLFLASLHLFDHTDLPAVLLNVRQVSEEVKQVCCSKMEGLNVLHLRLSPRTLMGKECFTPPVALPYGAVSPVSSTPSLREEFKVWCSAAGGMALSRTSTLNEERRRSLVSLRTSSIEVNSLSRQLSQRSWIEKTFIKRECCHFIPSTRDPTRCCCGRVENWHVGLNKQDDDDDHRRGGERWHPMRHTDVYPTDAYGTIEFQGGPHPSKAQYIRLSSLDSRPESVVHLLTKFWGLELPKLLITVHGGLLNFDLQPKLKRVFRKGLLKAARTTGAWIITNGTNTGVTKHVGDAISDRTAKAKNKVVAIGVAPWGIVERKEDLVGRDVVVPYHCVTSTKINSSVLNSNHSYFLLADNGTVGKYGGEIIFRRKLEKYIAQQKICMTNDFKGRGVPVICVVLEGGANTVRAVLEYVTDSPPVPVVVCDGSGRAADLLAFAHKYTLEDGTMPESLRDQLIMTIQKVFQYSLEQAEKLFIELMLCVKKKELITIFRMGEGAQDIDLAILTALLKGTNASAMDQLNLVLAWDRVDIARSHIFVYGQEWPEGGLEQAMMDALINDRVDFVKLLLENGVSMHTFLTIDRLEELYNTKQGPSNTLKYLTKDVLKHPTSSQRYILPEIGLVIQHLMGGAFRSSYCRRHFRQKYYAFRQSKVSSNSATLGNVVTTIPHLVNTRPVEYLFEYPFHDLMLWAVLMKRQRMALFMWQHGEEAMAKALVACKLYRAMAHEADQDDLEIELSEEFRSYSNEFQVLALELLEHCYKLDDDYSQQLLTYEIKTFSEQTNLSLAVAANHRQFIAHTACQVLLNDLWIGGMRMRKNTSLKVILGILFPPYMLALDFKSREELQLMPQTMEEHLDELEDSDAGSQRRVSLSSFDESQHQGHDLMAEEASENSIPMHSTAPKNENGSVPMDASTMSALPLKRKKSQLRASKKLYEFYNAPITKFWLHTLGYLAFLCIFMYTVLAKLQETPQWQELYVMAYISTLAVEKIRQIIASEPTKVSMKMRMYIGRVWNLWDTLAIVLFAVGVVLRCFPTYIKDAQLVYVIDVVLWNMRILEILSVNQYLGPYVKIIAKLIRDMAYYLIILFIVVTSYGVVRQAIHFQNTEVSWPRALRNIWFYPYWMIYGELFAEEIDPCEQEKGCSVYGAWVSPALMCIYLLIANILGVNLLIARFNATFIRNNAYSREIWMFQRYQLIIEYEMRPILPPPLIILTHLYLAFKYCRRRCKGKRDFFDNGLKLFLSREDTEKLHDFEEECMEDFFREKEHKFQSSSEERVRVINERVEAMTLRLEDLNTKESSLRLSLQTVDYRLMRLEEIASGTNEALTLLRTLLARQTTPPPPPPLHNIPGVTISHTPTSGIPHEEVVIDSERDLKRSGSPGPCLASWRNESVGGMGSTGEDEVMYSQPSPLLVHSKRPVREEYLRHFTSYTHTRQLSGESFSRISLEDAEAAETPQQAGEVQQFVNPPTSVPDANTVLNRESTSDQDLSHESLQQRRSGSNRLSLNITRAQSVGRVRSRSLLSPSVRFHEPANSGSGGMAEAGSSHDKESTGPVPPGTATVTPPRLAQLDLSGSQHLHVVGVGLPANTPISPVLTPLSPTHPHSSTAAFTAPDPDILPSAVRELCSVFTPLLSEYSTITDNIDVSCFRNLSPPRSPVPSGMTMSDPMGAVTPGSTRKRTESVSSKVKREELMEAEETERLKMEGLIRSRLRQISQDDASGSISDIARLVVSEMEMNQTATPPEDEDEDRVHETSAEMSEDVAEEVIFTTSEADSSDKILPVV